MDELEITTLDEQLNRQLIMENIKRKLLREIVDNCDELKNAIDDGSESPVDVDALARTLAAGDHFKQWKAELSRECARARSDSGSTSSYFFNCDDSTAKSSHVSPKDFFNSGISFAFAGTYGESVLAFAGKDFLRRAIEMLRREEDESENTYTATTKKLEILRGLSQIPATDLCENEHWDNFKRTLISLLSKDENENARKLSDGALRFLVKFMNSSNHDVAATALILLIEHLTNMKTCGALTKFRRGTKKLFFDTPTDAYVFRKFRLLHQFYSILLSKFGLRISENSLKIILEKTIDLLETSVLLEENYFATAGSENSKFLTSFSIFAILDPKAIWWLAYTHERLRRSILLSILQNRKVFLQFLIRRISNKSEGKNLERNVAERMLCSLIFYDEARATLSGVIADFPRVIMENILEKILDDKDNFFESTGKSFLHHFRFFDDRHVRRIIFELSKIDRSYDTKIRILRLVEIFLQADFRTTKNLLEIKMDECDYFGTKLMRSIGEIFYSAYSRDPNAPLTLVRAAVDVCVALCKTVFGRRVMNEHAEFLVYASKLVKEKSIGAGDFLPIVAATVAKNSPLNDAVKRLVSSASKINSPLDDLLQYRNVLWYRPVDSNSYALYGSLMTKKLGKIFEDSIEDFIDEEINYVASSNFIREFFPIFCYPQAVKILFEDPKNVEFRQLILAPFESQENLETKSFRILLCILETLLSNADILISMRHRYDLRKKIDHLFIKFYTYVGEECENENREENVPEICWQRCAVSTRLAEIYGLLNYLGGPMEKLKIATEQKSIPIRLLREKSFWFTADNLPSNVPSESNFSDLKYTNDKEELLKSFFDFLRKDCSAPCMDFLAAAVGGYEQKFTSENVEIDPPDLEIYDMILEYGANLKIFHDFEAASNSFRAVFTKLHSCNIICIDPFPKVDWFLGTIFLIFAGNEMKTVDFLMKFSSSEDWKNITCLWPNFRKGESDYSLLLHEEISTLVDEILEMELPGVAVALHRCRLTTNNVVTLWLNQCFVNILDWSEICNYLTVSTIGGRACQAIFCVCIFHFTSETICRLSQDESDSLQKFLAGPVLFQMGDHIEYFNHVRQKYCDNH